MKLKQGDVLTNPAIEPRTREVVDVDDSGVWIKVSNKKDAVAAHVPFDAINRWWKRVGGER